MKDVLAVYLADTVYQERFIQYLLQDGFSCSIVSFTQAEEAKEYLLREGAGVLVIDFNTMLEESILMKAGDRIYLSEAVQGMEPGAVQDTQEGKQGSSLGENVADVTKVRGMVLYRYQSMQVILTAINKLFHPAYEMPVETMNMKGLAEEKSCHIYYLSTVSGGIDLSGTAYLFSHELQKDGNVIYINLSQFEDLSQFTNQQNHRSLSDVIYYLKQQQEEISDKILDCIAVSNGVSYLNPVDHGLDLMELGAEEIRQLLEEIRKLKKYSNIVIAGTVLCEGTLELLRTSDTTYLLSDGSEQAEHKNECFFRQMGQLLPEEKISRIFPVAVPKEWNYAGSRKELIRSSQEVGRLLGLCSESIGGGHAGSQTGVTRIST